MKTPQISIHLLTRGKWHLEMESYWWENRKNPFSPYSNAINYSYEFSPQCLSTGAFSHGYCPWTRTLPRVSQLATLVLDGAGRPVRNCCRCNLQPHGGTRLSFFWEEQRPQSQGSLKPGMFQIRWKMNLCFKSCLLHSLNGKEKPKDIKGDSAEAQEIMGEGEIVAGRPWRVAGKWDLPPWCLYLALLPAFLLMFLSELITSKWTIQRVSAPIQGLCEPWLNFKIPEFFL